MSDTPLPPGTYQNTWGGHDENAVWLTPEELDWLIAEYKPYTSTLSPPSKAVRKAAARDELDWNI